MGKLGFKEAGRKLFDALSGTVRRFVFAVVLAAASAVIMIVFVHLQDNLDATQVEWFQRIAMVLVLGVPFALLVKVYLETFEKKSKLLIVGLYALVLAFLVLYLFVGLPELGRTSIIRYTGVSIFFWGVFLIVPFVTGRPKVEIQTFTICWRLLVTMFYCGIIIGGLSGILYSLKELLNVPIVDKHYTDTTLVVAGVILPSFFFAGIPQKDASLHETHTKFFRILLLYVLMPILAAYTAVLYIYFIRILVVHELPNNIIGNLVLWYSIVGVLVLYLSKPETAVNKWAKFFDRWFPRLLLLPLGMMFVAIFIRIHHYGVTEPRYFTIVGGLWSLAMALFVVFSKPEKRRNIIIPLAASFLAVLSVLGPWSAFSLSINSQNQRLSALLTENNLVADGKLVKNSDLSQDVKSNISSDILYFNNYHEIDDITAFSGYETLDDVERAIGFELYEVYYNSQPDYLYYYQKDSDYSFDISPYDYLVFSRNPNARFETQIGTISMSDGFSDSTNDVQQIILSLNDQELFRRSIADFAQALSENYDGQSELDRDALTFTYPLDKMTLTIVFFNIEASDTPDGTETGWAEYIALIDILE